MFKCHGEGGDADHAKENEELPELRHIEAQYSAYDVFEADESGLYYCCPPVYHYKTRSPPGAEAGQGAVHIHAMHECARHRPAPSAGIGASTELKVLWSRCGGGAWV